MRAVVAFALATLALSLGSQNASAQVTVQQHLTFTPSPIISGTTTTIAPNSASAAVFRIRGILGIGGSFSFTLPSVLLHSNGSTTMPITFSTSSASYRFGNATPGGTVFNPVNGVGGLYIVVLTDIYIFLGGTLTPPLNQKSGTYTGTIVFTSSALL